MEGKSFCQGKERLGLDVTSDDRAASCILCRGWAATEESEMDLFFLLKPEDVLFWHPQCEKQNEGLE